MSRPGDGDRGAGARDGGQQAPTGQSGPELGALLVTDQADRVNMT